MHYPMRTCCGMGPNMDWVHGWMPVYWGIPKIIRRAEFPITS